MKAINQNYGKAVSLHEVEEIKEIARAYYLVSEDEFLELYSIIELKDIAHKLTGELVEHRRRAEYVQMIKEKKLEVRMLGNEILSKLNLITLNEYYQLEIKKPAWCTESQ